MPKLPRYYGNHYVFIYRPKILSREFCKKIHLFQKNNEW